MNKINPINGIIVSLLLTTPLTYAETQYPASDFKPKVVFQDAEQIAKTTATTATTESKAASKADSRYPAADFQPKVVYKDTEYKHSQPSAAPSSSNMSSTKSAASTSSSGAIEDKTSGEKEKSKQSNNWIFLLVFAAAGAVFLRKRLKCETSEIKREARPAYNTEPSGMTGVAKYINRATGTSVSRYLEKQAVTQKPETGVAKYMAKQTSSTKVKPSAATGVEKYLRNRG